MAIFMIIRLDFHPHPHPHPLSLLLSIINLGNSKSRRILFAIFLIS
jgi:hypothetical protein